MDTELHPLILMIGLNHKIAPLDVRGCLVFNSEKIPPALHELVGMGGCGDPVITEAVLLSTCNRTEIYTQADDLDRAELFLRDFLVHHGGPEMEKIRCMAYVKRGKEAVLHLMNVTAGLDSLVLGENEILGQVRSAFEMAKNAGTSGVILSALFRNAIQAGKRVRNETGIGRLNISMADIVVKLAQESFGSLKERTALIIGAGKISSITARALLKAGLRWIVVANRTYERAQKLAQTLNGTVVHFDRLDESLVSADIVICSTGAPHLVLHADTVAKAQAARNGRPLVVADLAVPRDADPRIAELPNVKLVNMDDLEQIVKTSHPLTAAICRAAEVIVEQELDNFIGWCSARRSAPVIQALFDKADNIYQAEVEQTLRRMGQLTPHQQTLIHSMGKAIVGKMLHEPALFLRELPQDEEASSYIEIIRDLYGIQ